MSTKPEPIHEGKTNKKKEVFASHRAPVGMGKPLGDLLNDAELKQLSRMARKCNVPETVLVRDLIIEYLDKDAEEQPEACSLA